MLASLKKIIVVVVIVAVVVVVIVVLVLVIVIVVVCFFETRSLFVTQASPELITHISTFIMPDLFIFLFIFHLSFA